MRKVPIKKEVCRKCRIIHTPELQKGVALEVWEAWWHRKVCPGTTCPANIVKAYHSKMLAKVARITLPPGWAFQLHFGNSVDFDDKSPFCRIPEWCPHKKQHE